MTNDALPELKRNTEQEAPDDRRNEHPRESIVDVRLRRITKSDARVRLTARDVRAGVFANELTVGDQFWLVRVEEPRCHKMSNGFPHEVAVSVGNGGGNAVERHAGVLDGPQ